MTITGQCICFWYFCSVCPHFDSPSVAWCVPCIWSSCWAHCV